MAIKLKLQYDYFEFTIVQERQFIKNFLVAKDGG